MQTVTVFDAACEEPAAAPSRAMVALGAFGREQRESLRLAAEQSSFALEAFTGVEEAVRWMEGHRPHALLVDPTVRGAQTLCVEARARAMLAHVPILAVTREVGDLAFAEVFGWGGDDVVPLSAARPLTRRLRALPPELPAPPAETRGGALVADSDRTRRVVIGRVLRNAGYSVTFALGADDVVPRARDIAPRIVVTTWEPEETARALRSARDAGSAATFIVTCPPRDLRVARSELEGCDDSVVTDGYAPPENVLFLANELASRSGPDHRASARLLYGTTVAFRAAGRDHDELGFTYNVSSGGLYVRTLAPPEQEVVWLELTPPRSERRVRLEAHVAWRRRFGPAERSTVPPGFGVQITDGAAADLAAWRAGYRNFADALG